MKQLFKAHPYATSGFALAAAVTLFFLVRIIWSAVYWMDPAHHNQTIKPWMTVGYIGQSWHLKPPEIDAAAGLPGPQGHGPWTMQEIAKSRGVPVDDILKLVTDAVQKLEAQKHGPEKVAP